MIATWITSQLVFDGFVNGLVIGLLAMGLVLIFRSTRIVNFAVGSLGVVGATLLALMVVNYSVPFWLAVAVASAVGLAIGAIIELVVVRRLFVAARVTLLVATIGVSQLLGALVLALPKVRGLGATTYPVALTGAWTVAGVRISGPQLAIIVAVPLLATALGVFLNRTRLGTAVTASADNARLARTVGVNPKFVSTLVWSVAGLLSTVSMILVAGQSGRATGITNLGPNTMVRALAAMVIASMVSFRVAVVAGIAIGVGQALVRFNVEQAGLVEFLLFLVVLIAVWRRARREDPDAADVSFGASLRPLPQRVRALWWIRVLPASAFALLLVGAAVLPLIVTKPSRILLYGTVLATAICALSVTVLTGWAGQLSLGQMAFAGLSALTAAALTRGPLPFAASVLVAAVATAALAAIVGAGALRVNGLLLAVVTFSFAIAASQYLYRRPILSGDNQNSVPLRRGRLLGLDLGSQRTYYYVLLGVLTLVVVGLARVGRSGAGRSIIAVRDNPRGAAAYTVSPGRTRITAFALSGGVAGLGGALLAGVIQNVPLTERFFQVDDSLQLVSISVIGGLGALSGAILGALWVVGLPAFFPDNELLPLFASGAGVVVLLLYFPGGLAQLAHAVRDAIVRTAERRLAPATARTGSRSISGQPSVSLPSPPPAAGGSARVEQPALVADGITVRFGGKVAVDDVTIVVARGSIVGLIGTNGAGKTTLLNAVGGFVPALGRVVLADVDVSRRSPAARARAGLGRTFQTARLFPTLSVRDTLLVALEAHGRTGVAATMLSLPGSIRRERANVVRANELIDLFGLGRYADRRIEELSTGTRRIVELAGLIAVGASVICLDEPTAGVAQREAEALAPLLVTVRAELDAALIVIEHDMPFIMSISDHLYCLEAGRVIASGAPVDVRNDPLVVASYLGSDQRAIDRSNAAAGNHVRAEKG